MTVVYALAQTKTKHWGIAWFLIAAIGAFISMTVTATSPATGKFVGYCAIGLAELPILGLIAAVGSKLIVLAHAGANKLLGKKPEDILHKSMQKKESKVASSKAKNSTKKRNTSAKVNSSSGKSSPAKMKARR